MQYLRNTGYLTGWANELPPGTLLARTIAERPITLFRDQEGVVRALRDWCPHRFAPLSKGRLVSGIIRCGYHGLAFNGDGSCVDNPHGPISRALRARSFPVVSILFRPGKRLLSCCVGAMVFVATTIAVPTRGPGSNIDGTDSCRLMEGISSVTPMVPISIRTPACVHMEPAWGSRCKRSPAGLTTVGCGRM